MLEEISKDRLMWFPEAGIGYFPVKKFTKNQEYFNLYTKFSETILGKNLTTARIEMVDRHHLGSLIDIGIGCGSFVEARPSTNGYDINNDAVEWLIKKNLYIDIFSKKFNSIKSFEAMSFWDSLEHLPNPIEYLKLVKKYVFISIPIFKDINHILESKHYKPEEHVWYFTKYGLIKFMSTQGFSLSEVNRREEQLGREDIRSFVFIRRWSE